ncbi:MAG: efflux RND transporter periplasmic adaptor subunit [Betaproteobacteria bacterium]|nr:efflux RND transporter periplasmic adaptor subunit [Betaproteobacteria bacterium]
MTHPRLIQRLFLLVSVLISTSSASVCAQQDSKAGKADKAKAALTVQVVQAQRADWPLQLRASGNIAAWQEAILSAEVGGLRIAEISVNVGDSVKAGQVLATLDSAAVQIDLAQAQATLAEAEAALTEARANAARAREVQASGAVSQQQISQWLTAEKTAEARALSAQAQRDAQQLRLARSSVLAPDAGTISSRLATLGAVVAPGQELFRLIRGDRLEWRAEVTATELAQLRSGQSVQVAASGSAPANNSMLSGRIRMLAPTVDVQSRNALVYVDLPANAMRAGLRPGMQVRGEFTLGNANALSLPLQAISMRDGFSYVFAVGDDQRVRQIKVQLGRRSMDRVEISSAIDNKARYVAAGTAFLSDGDLVHVVPGPAAVPSATKAP